MNSPGATLANSLAKMSVRRPTSSSYTSALFDREASQGLLHDEPAGLDSPADSVHSRGAAHSKDPNTIITINVGGTRFETHLKTLRKQPNFFSAMFSGNFNITPSSDGSYFIDRNPRYFELILDFLRKTTVNILGMDVRQLSDFRDEAEYYQITDLYKFLNAKIEEETNPQPDTSWHDSTGPLQGIRRIEGTNLCFMVAKEFYWDLKKEFAPPKGYKWATCYEYIMEIERCSVALENRHDYVHMDVGGWNRYRWHDMYKVVFVFSDTCIHYRAVHSGMRLRSRAKTVVPLSEPGGIILRTGDGEERFRVGFGLNDENKMIWQGFAGIVCIKDDTTSPKNR